ncbi:MAG TPA: NAD(P)H-binding protein [Polyangiaceae bacterium]|nr:NAD(P)H-binding protein [Polyangiaceae bacterium]
MAEPRTALLVGATGLIGAFVLKRLLDSAHYQRVTVWVRRPIQTKHPKLTVEVVDFDKIGERRVDAEDVFCCLGTTIKVAGSQEAFRRVDYEYPVALAKAAAKGGASRILVVSALGARPDSTVFYSRVKGEMQDAVRAAGVPTTIFFQPSMLSGRVENKRFWEDVATAVGNVIGPLLGKYRPIHGDIVAQAMVKAAVEGRPSGVIESGEIRKLAAGK